MSGLIGAGPTAEALIGDSARNDSRSCVALPREVGLLRRRVIIRRFWKS